MNKKLVPCQNETSEESLFKALHYKKSLIVFNCEMTSSESDKKKLIDEISNIIEHTTEPKFIVMMEQELDTKQLANEVREPIGPMSL